MSGPASIQISSVLTDAPASGVIPVLLVGAIGLLLWLAGYRILRAGIAGLCFILGLCIGWILMDVLGRPVEPWFGGCVTGIMFALVGAFASKLIIAVAMAAVLSLASPLATLSLAELGGLTLHASASSHEEDSAEATALFDLSRNDDASGGEAIESGSVELLDNAIDVLMTDQQAGNIENVKSKIDELRGRLPAIDADTQGHIDRVREAAGDTISSLWSTWEGTDGRMRRTLLASAIIGGLLGLLCGTLSPRFSGSVVTSMAGSLIVLACAWIILMRADVPGGSWMPASPLGWSICWFCVAIIGLCIQWTFRRQPADKAA